MADVVDESLVAAACSGDQSALDELVKQYLPLVYNIVGRALLQRADVDDVVQEVMLRVVRGLPGVRDPRAFRSWLVAVTTNEVRTYLRARPRSPLPIEEIVDHSDPGADFVDLTLTELGLSGQRREAAQATRWLDDDDRELLALWWLVAAGSLTRGEMVRALELPDHHVTVRVGRMKAQLDTARMVVRALSASDGGARCARLGAMAAQWDRRPTPLWRKRFARHIRECGYCSAQHGEMIAAERLLVNLTLVPVPIGFVAYLFRWLHSGTGGVPVLRAAARPHPLHAAVKPLVALGIAAAVGAGLVGVHALNPFRSTGSSTGAGSRPMADPTAEAAGSPTAATSGTPTRTPSPSRSPAARHSHTASAKPSASRSAAATKAAAPAPSGTNSASAVQQVLALINKARAQSGLAALTITSGLTTSATRHNQTMAGGCGLSHQCPGEASLGDRISAAGVSWGAVGENIGEAGPITDTSARIAAAAVGLTQSMLDERPPNDGHRKNILSTAYHHVGIAVFRDSAGTVWLTQDFSN